MPPSAWGEVFLVLGMVIGVMALPQQSSPSFPSSSVTFARQNRQQESIPSAPSFRSNPVISEQNLKCLLLADAEGKDTSSCTSSGVEIFPPIKTTHSQPSAFASSGANHDAAPAANCECVPYWQCKDNNLSKITVEEGEGQSSVAFDLRSNLNLGCNGDPQMICCQLVDFSSRPPSPPPVNPQCGERNDVGVGSTILGFEDQQSQFGEFPWSAAIVTSPGFGSSDTPLYTAGGSLIHPQVVLTVAHSMLNYTADHLKVHLGEWNLAGKTEAVPHQEIQVKEVLFHPDYHKVKQHYDVALLVLDQPAVLGATVNTICLPSKLQDYVSDDCVVSGWGKTDFNKKAKFQRVMKKVSLPVVDHAQCQAALQGTRLGPRFTLHDSFLCAGGQKEGQDACTGDGGSPLACRLQSDARRYVQVGVVAWGIGCGTLGVPGVYADVLKARPWMDQVINDHFSNAGGMSVKFDLRISTVS